MENLTGEKEVSEQLKFENLVPEEKETLEIIPIRADGLQPRKLEDILPDFNIKKDTYIIYPTGGCHPFYGVPNTLPRYQQKIWPYVKRIKFSEKFKSEKTRNNARKGILRETQTNEQLNPFLGGNYYCINLELNKQCVRYNYTRILKNGKYSKTKDAVSKQLRLHRLVALAWILNPENKPFVMHINNDPTHYLIENLRWGTARENSKGVLNKRPDTMEQKYQGLINKGAVKI